MTDFEKLLQKALSDENFAGNLADPDTASAALTQLGIQPTPEKLAALQACVKPMRAAYDAFGGQLDPG